MSMNRSLAAGSGKVYGTLCSKAVEVVVVVVCKCVRQAGWGHGRV